jgi:hypothetical protein
MSGDERGAAVTQGCRTAAEPLPGTEEVLDARERRFDSFMERYVPYLGLAIGTALTPVIASTEGYWLVTAPLVLIAAAWSYVFVTRRPTLTSDPRLGPVYVVGLLVMMAVLVYQSPFYGSRPWPGTCTRSPTCVAAGAGSAWWPPRRWPATRSWAAV